jgi:hypothetical protein
VIADSLKSQQLQFFVIEQGIIQVLGPDQGTPIRPPVK